MNGLDPAHPLKATLWQAASLLGLLLLFLPALGPVVDHHFAERQFNHVHLYLGVATPSHEHSFRTPHTHHAQPAPQGTDSLADGIVYLTSYDGQDAGSFLLTSPVLNSSIVRPIPPGLSLLHGWSVEAVLPPEVSVPPPKPPPQA